MVKATVELLKQESANFDLECIFQLNLSNKDVDDLDQTCQCLNLDVLNLSSNRITNCANLRPLAKLQYLNLSNNRIKSLSGLEGLESLKMLNLTDNQLETLDEFHSLTNLKNFTQLILAGTPKSSSSNPICLKNRNYKQDVKNILNRLTSVDGETFNDDQSRSKLHNVDDLLDQLTHHMTSTKSTSATAVLEVDSKRPWISRRTTGDKNNTEEEKELKLFGGDNKSEATKQNLEKIEAERRKFIETCGQFLIDED